MSQRTGPTTTAAVPLRTTRPPIDAGSVEAGRGRSTTPAATYRELRLKGFTGDEAGNLTAYLNGIRPVEGGWTPREIERLLFMRHLVGHVWGNARWDVWPAAASSCCGPLLAETAEESARSSGVVADAAVPSHI